MDSINNMDLFSGDNYGHKTNILPVSEATSSEAKAEIKHYMGLGLSASELRIACDFPGGPETVVVSKTGMIKLAKQSPLGGIEAAARIQAMMNAATLQSFGEAKEAGYSLTIDEELDIASSRGGQ